MTTAKQIVRALAAAHLQSALDVGDLGEGWANYLGVTVELAVPKA